MISPYNDPCRVSTFDSQEQLQRRRFEESKERCAVPELSLRILSRFLQIWAIENSLIRTWVKELHPRKLTWH